MTVQPGLQIERSPILAAPEVTAFIRGWTAEDRYARFGSTGEASAAWLIEDLLSHADHRAFTARDGHACVALLDYVVTANELDFGIVVRAGYRRRAIAKRMIAALIASVSPAARIVAQCRFDNRAAVRLLRACGFVPAAMRHGEIAWEFSRQ